MIRFQLVPLPIGTFEPLFSMSDTELRERGARRCVVDAMPGYPCRVSLQDAEPGETVILVPFTHHDTGSPYRASGPIYVRERATPARPAVNEIPEMIRRRSLSIRAYDADGMMVGAAVAEGSVLAEHIANVFGDPSVAYLHLHNAGPGCYNCRVDRA